MLLRRLSPADKKAFLLQEHSILAQEIATGVRCSNEPDFPCVLIAASFVDQCLASLLEEIGLHPAG